MSEQPTNRRRFLRILASAAALPAGGALLTMAPLRAQSPPRLAEDDPAAFALGYVHDASDVDLSKYPRYEAGQICGNCQQWQDDPEVEWAPCAIFPGRQVRNAGWCSVWVPKAR